LNKSRFEFFETYIPNWKGLKVLDVGCGGGLACEFLASEAPMSQVLIYLSLIKAAQEQAKKSYLKIDYQSGVAENLPYQKTLLIVVCV
jgi:2-polyprenyl-6-hydroxyphenyl methylase/3-demethylubiquinone-9 3-methyltransferase